MESERLEALVQAGVLSFLSIFTTVLLVVLARRAANGRLARNQWAGIRTPSTLRSDRGWVAGHRAALRLTPLFLLMNARDVRRVIRGRTVRVESRRSQARRIRRHRRDNRVWWSIARTSRGTPRNRPMLAPTTSSRDEDLDAVTSHRHRAGRKCRAVCDSSGGADEQAQRFATWYPTFASNTHERSWAVKLAGEGRSCALLDRLLGNAGHGLALGLHGY